MNVSDALARVVGGVSDIRDIKITETNTDEIVREIYQSGSASKEATEKLSQIDISGDTGAKESEHHE